MTLIIFYFWAGSSWYENDLYYQVANSENSFIDKDDTLRISTYNIGYLSGMTNNNPVARSEGLFSENLERSVRILSNLDLDFLALQEIDFYSERSYEYNQYDSLLQRLDFPNGAKAVNWDKSYVPFPYWPIKYQFGRILSGQAILSKMKLLKQDITVLSKPKNAPFYYNKFYLDRLIQTTFIPVNNSDTLAIMNVHLEAF
ncbi:MAG: hypothetical protein R3321_05010, partial [Nitrososphaeraceae archaeon]|nr:hypothetical protein [Nitrososphaeraceae archaeon]